MEKKIWFVSFSPAGGTRAVVALLAERIAKALGGQTEEIDFTKKENMRNPPLQISISSNYYIHWINAVLSVLL